MQRGRDLLPAIHGGPAAWRGVSRREAGVVEDRQVVRDRGFRRVERHSEFGRGLLMILQRDEQGEAQWVRDRPEDVGRDGLGHHRGP